MRHLVLVMIHSDGQRACHRQSYGRFALQNVFIPSVRFYKFIWVFLLSFFVRIMRMRLQSRPLFWSLTA